MRAMRRTARPAWRAAPESCVGIKGSTSRLEQKSENSLPGSCGSSLTSISFLSPGSSILTYQVSSGLLSSMGSRPSSQASSCQSIRVDDSMQSGPTSSTNVQEDKTGGDMKNSDQVTKAEQPASMGIPL
ncbi:hypothetical protein TREES_T100000423 [Tupaia chinensis]|uniref:Uncharacterized protein n=1 Tax=Tupaia chinensis TaxID=246437 RepID=L9KVB4_TUPCH|nr:hypothetical protein TREES_T100000423 [Tupaia chinensis]